MLTHAAVREFLAANPGATSMSVERAFRFDSMMSLHAVLDCMVASGEVVSSDQHGPGHLYFKRFALAPSTSRPNSHGATVAGG